jgi:alcohol dehydrogenase class IV
MATAGTALHHKLCHVIGGTYRVDHGEAHAVLLPYVAAYNAPASPAALERVARALGGSQADASRAGRAAAASQTAREAAPGLRRLAERLGAPRGLAAIGLPAEALDDVLERTLDAVGDSNPRRPDAATLGKLLDDAYAGRPPGAYE